MEIPWQGLSEDVLRRVIEEFVSREGTDYGHSDYSLDQKVDRVLGQLRRGQAILCFDSDNETCHILPVSERYKMTKGPSTPPSPDL